MEISPTERAKPHSALLLTACLCLLPLAGCSPKKLALNALAKTLGESAGVFASDEDPELVRDALPFALKTVEALLVQAPDNVDLLLAACSGFTQYSYAFVETDAFLLETESYRRAKALRLRALKLYLRARDYCLDGLEVEYPDLRRRLETAPETAVVELEASSSALIFWAGASWASAISLGLDRPELVADLPVLRALLGRALELDANYGDGLVHEAFVALDSLPPELGGSEQRARESFRRALELAGGQSASAYVTLARGVSVAKQDRGEFEALLRAALEVDPAALPARQLANLVAQRRARGLLERVDEFFFDDLEGDDDLFEEEPAGEADPEGSAAFGSPHGGHRPVASPGDFPGGGRSEKTGADAARRSL